MFKAQLLSLAAGLGLLVARLDGADRLPDPEKKNDPQRTTSGGKFFWSDQFYFHGWHIQHNAVLGYCRLLDDKERQYICGSFEECRQKLADIQREKNLQPMRGTAVLVLHGLLRNRTAMAPLCDHLRQKGGYQVIPVGYASSLEGIADHARNLDKIVRGLDQVEEIHLVGHSLGNLVIRHYLRDQADDELSRSADARINRIVMLAPPNQGSQLARRFREQAVMKLVWGLPAHEMANWDTLEPKLATPDCEFGIIAGSPQKSYLKNPLVTGADDYVLSVDETKLPGARDFIVLPLSHSAMRQDKKCLDYTLRFLKEGHFISADKRQPLAKLNATR